MRKEQKDAIILSHPILDQIAGGLRQKGRFQHILSGEEASQLLKSLVLNLMESQGSFKAAIEGDPDIHIYRGKVRFGARIEVSEPVTASVDLALEMKPGQEDGRLQGDVTRWNLSNMDRGTSALFKALNVKGRVEQAIGEPNEALFDALTKQLKPRGTEITGLGLYFPTNDAIQIVLEGESLA